METRDLLLRFVENPDLAVEIKKGGSGRRFFRIPSKEHGHAILCVYDDSREENALAPEIARFLGEKIGLRVPQVYAWNPELRTILFEDLGGKDLRSLDDGDDAVRSLARRDVVRQLAKLHSPESLEIFRREGPKTMPGFGSALYRWERDYFRQHALPRLFQGELPAERAALLETELAALAARLELMPEALVHRDCQSENILWKDDHAYFIDFQGMRVGTGFYDLASFLYDPYTLFTNGERARLLGDYAEAAGTPRDLTFIGNFFDAAAQRLMQALGAYHFLAHEKGKTEYLAFVRPALGNLVAVTKENKELPVLRALAEETYLQLIVSSGEVVL